MKLNPTGQDWDIWGIFSPVGASPGFSIRLNPRRRSLIELLVALY